MTTSLTVTALPKPFVRPSPPDAAKMLGVFVMLVAILYFGKEVLVPVTLALLLAFILAPLVDLLTRLRLGRVPSVLLGVILALGVIVAIGSVIGTQIAALTEDLPQYTHTIQDKIGKVKHYTTGRLSKWADELGPQLTKPTPPAPGQPQGNLPQAQLAAPAAPPEPPMAIAERYVSSVLSPLATIGIVFVVAVFALLQREDLRNRLIRLVGSHDLHHTTVAIDDGTKRLSKYFTTQLIINTIFGIVVGIGLLVIGVPNPVLWAIVSGLLRFVPYVGSPISAALPIALAAAVDPHWSMVIETAAFYAVIELLTAQAIEPMVYGNSTGLSPFSVVVAAIFWSWVWGPVGLLLSTPLTLCLVVIGRHDQRLAFLDVILGDRPALTPSEIFYQRMLAGDPDEAEDQAELLLKEVSLSSYYDEVVVTGLRRAAVDAERGAIDRDQLNCTRTAVEALIAGLEQHTDKQPDPKKDEPSPLLGDDDDAVRHNPDPQSISQETDNLTEAWRHQPAVLCVAGRGPLDEAAAAMLAQLLGKHGMNARLVRYDEASRERIGTLEVSGAAMACICYLDIAATPASLRYLTQRVRKHMPKDAPLLIGLWPADDPSGKAASVREMVHADVYASSLEQAVTACAEVALQAAAR